MKQIFLNHEKKKDTYTNCLPTEEAHRLRNQVTHVMSRVVSTSWLCIAHNL